MPLGGPSAAALPTAGLYTRNSLLSIRPLRRPLQRQQLAAASLPAMGLQRHGRQLAQQLAHQIYSWRRATTAGAWRPLHGSSIAPRAAGGAIGSGSSGSGSSGSGSSSGSGGNGSAGSGRYANGAGPQGPTASPQPPSSSLSSSASSSASAPQGPSADIIQQQRRQQQAYLSGGSRPPGGAARGPQPVPPLSAAAAAAAGASTAPRLPPGLEELLVRAEKDAGLRARLARSTNKPSAFLQELASSGIRGAGADRDMLRALDAAGINELAVFRALKAAKQAAGGKGYGNSAKGSDPMPVLRHLRAAAEAKTADEASLAEAQVQQPLEQQQQQQHIPPWQRQPQPAQQAQQQAQQAQAAGGGAAPLAQAPPGGPASQASPAAGAAAAAGATAPAAPAVPATPPASSPGSGSGSGSASGLQGLLTARGIVLPQYSPGTYNHQLCPACQGGPSGEKSLSVTIDENARSAVWYCFRTKCAATGAASLDRGQGADAGSAMPPMRKRKEEPPVRPDPSLLEKPSGAVLEFLLSRGISTETLERGGVAQQRLFVPANQREETVIAFPYYKEGQLVNVKYRTLDKKFWQVKGAEKVLYGLEGIGAGATEVVIVEGEMDKLSLDEAGLQHVVSVPDGAPARVRDGELPPADQDSKFSYLWNCRQWLDQAPKVIIATDNDAPGDALAEELARRLGRERCWRVRWPLTRADHEYAAALAGVQLASPGGRAGEGGALGGAVPEWEVEEQEGVVLGGEGELEGASGGSGGSDLEAAGAGAAGSSEREGSGSGSSSGAAAAAAVGGESEDGYGSAVVLSEEEGLRPASSTSGGSGSTSGGSTIAGAQQAERDEWYRKDANEVLLKDGPEMLRAFVAAAEPLPIRGLLRFHEYYEDIVKHYHLQLRDAQGVSTGWPTLDELYKVVPGELTIVTGVPNSGKSEWLDALCCNLADMHGWTFAMCSMEKKATDHARHLIEKCVGKPFFDLPYAKGAPRMTPEELDEGLDWVDDRFHLIRYEDDNLPSIDWVLDIAKAAVYRYGIRGLVIDPYNELDHQRPSSMTETEYVSQMLGKIKRFAQTCGVHVWFVAHPRQLREWKGGAPNLYDISGSAHFINKADNGVVVHRERDPDAPNNFEVQILVRKVRNKAAGTIGDCTLEYDRANGRYIDPDMEQYSARTARRVRYARPQQGAQQAQQQRAPAQGGQAPQRAPQPPQQQLSPQQVAAQQAQQLSDWQAQREQARQAREQGGGGGGSTWGPPPVGQQAAAYEGSSSSSSGLGQPDPMSMAAGELDAGDAISVGGTEYEVSAWGTLEPVGGSNGGFE